MNARRAPRRVIVLIGAALALGIAVLAPRVGGPEAPGGPGAARERGPEDPSGPTLLGGRGAPDGTAPDSAGAGAGTAGRDPSAAPPEAAGPPAPALSPPPLEFGALAPEAVESRLVEGESPTLTLRRSDVVGTVGRGGERDVATPGLLRWLGLARVERPERAPSEAPDDTEEPASTGIRGVVVAEDGTPLRGAEVILYSSFYLRQAFYDHRVRQIGRVLTDEEGRFDLRPVALDTVHFGADGEVLVTVRHPRLPDLVAQRLPAIVPGRESDVGRLVLPGKSAVVRGRIRDMADRPVAGAVVRVSGAFNPADYDKVERMVVLDACPSATTDADGRYELTDFAPGVHDISVHVRIDCVVHGSGRWEGEQEWSPQVRARNSVRGRVVAPDGEAVAAAVVAGGGNWTPTNADGTFWLDNVDDGPLALEVSHHAWHTVTVHDVPTDAEDVLVRMERPLARVTLQVVDGEGRPVPLVALDFAWPAGVPPPRFMPDSRYWHDAQGVFAIVVPEGASGATVSDERGATCALAAEDLVDGNRRRVVLADPPGAH